MNNSKSFTDYFNIKDNRYFYKNTLIGNIYITYYPEVTFAEPNTVSTISHMDVYVNKSNKNDITYSLNNHLYRCDDFDKEQAKDNYLYSGCSYTFGTGLPYESLWALNLNRNLNGNKFFNLAMHGASYDQIINDLYDYIRMFGKPKAIFLLLPNLERIPSFDYHGDKPYMRNSHIKTYPSDKYKLFFKHNQPEILVYRFYKLLQQFEEYCSLQNIPLLWTTWDLELDKVIVNCLEFNNFFSLFSDEKVSMALEVDKMTNDVVEDPMAKKYFYKARDPHPSGRTNIFYQKAFELEWNRYCEKANIES